MWRMCSLCWKKRCKCTKKAQSSTVSSTPLPYQKLFIALTIQFAQVFGSVVLFPFLPFMVHDFFPDLPKEELGSKAGFLGSSYFIGSFAGSMAWGWLSDTWGRRPALLLGCIGTMLSALLFGHSQTFAIAVTARFLWGFLNGNVGVVKTYLSEILDDSNQAKGFSIFGVASGIGRLLGSVVGGFLSQPASKYSLFQNDYFCKYRYVLPIYVNVGIVLIGFTSAILFMEETLRQKSKESPSSDQASTESDSICTERTSGIEMVRLTGISNIDHEIDDDDDDDTRTYIDSEVFSTDTDQLLPEEHIIVDVVNHPPLSTRNNFISKLRHIDYLYPIKSLYHRQKEQFILCCYCFVPSHNRVGGTTLKDLSPRYVFNKIINRIVMMLKLLVDRPVIVSVLSYAFLGGLMLISNEALPLLLVTDHEHGGYNMDDNEIAVLIMVSGIVILFYQVFVYSRLVKYIGYRNILRIKIVIFAISSLVLPWSNRITGPIDEPLQPYNVSGSGSGSGMSPEFGFCGFTKSDEAVNQNSISRIPISVWAVLLLSIIPTFIARVTATITTIVLVNNSTVMATRGTVNGLGQTLVGVFRSIGPIIGGLLFAWTESNGLSWPLNYHLTFEMCFVLSIALIIFTFCLPKSIEKKRVS